MPHARPVEKVVCLLIGGQAQDAATAVAHDIAAAKGTSLPGLAAVDPYAPKVRSTLREAWRNFVGNVDSDAMRRSARLAIEDFEMQNRRRRVAVNRVVPGDAWGDLIPRMAEHDLAVIPAMVGVDGVPDGIDSEAATTLGNASLVSVLRVTRRPLEVNSILLVVANTAACERLAQGLRRLGLWRDARISILPLDSERASVARNVRSTVDELLADGRHSTLLPSLRLDFEEPDLNWVIGSFQVAVMGHLTNGSACSTLYEMTSSRACPHGCRWSICHADAPRGSSSTERRGPGGGRLPRPRILDSPLL